MAAEENKSVVRRLIGEVWNKGDISLAENLISSTYIDHSAPGLPPGVESFKQVATMFRTAFPDLNITLEDQIAEGDKVVSRVALHATHTGDFMGIPPTGKAFNMTGIRIDRLADGKIVEHWANFDQFGMMQQLGVIPSN